MYAFPVFLKKIRATSGLSQKELAEILDMSTVLIAKIETGKKPPSKKLVIRLANKMGVRPTSLTPFIMNLDEGGIRELSKIEKTLLRAVERVQFEIIEKNAPKLKKYVSE